MCYFNRILNKYIEFNFNFIKFYIQAQLFIINKEIALLI